MEDTETKVISATEYKLAPPENTGLIGVGVLGARRIISVSITPIRPGDLPDTQAYLDSLMELRFPNGEREQMIKDSNERRRKYLKDHPQDANDEDRRNGLI